MLAPGTVLQDRYRIVRQLGKGGMGTVYEAHHTKLKHTVAVKETVFSEVHLTKAFEREAQLLARLQHPALPKVSDYFSQDDGHFLVMEFVQGKDLSESLTERGAAFPVEQVLQWADQLLDALEYLHGQQPPVIHRDIKPANLKVAANGRVSLLDFGLAKGLHTQMSRVTGGASVQAYTPGYAPVEQMQGSGTDARSDLFSLGATLYHLITGTPPVDALTRGMNVVNGDPDPLRPSHTVNTQINPEISTVLHQALALNREKRPVTATELRRMLREATKRKEPVKPIEPSDPVPANPGVMSGEAETVVSTKPFQVPSPGPEAFQTRPMVDQLAQTVADAQQSGRTKAAPTRPAPQPPRPMEPTIPAPPPKSVVPLPVKPPQPRGTNWVLVSVVGILLIGLIAVGINLTGKSNQPTTVETPPVSIPTSGSTTIKNSIGMEFMEIPAGNFQMGSPASEAERGGDEGPQHRVTFSQPFYLGKYEVTQAEWQAVMGNNPSNFKGDRLPVENVSWNDCQEFLKKLNAKKDGYTYRLPSEAEWEYACRAGTETPFSFGENITTDQVNYDGNYPYAGVAKGKYRETTTLAGSFPANAWGLHDMHGNVYEWCQDWYQGNYDGAPRDGRAWESVSDKQFRVLRGGSWGNYADKCRSANRGRIIPEVRSRDGGFRVAAASTLLNRN